MNKMNTINKVIDEFNICIIKNVDIFNAYNIDLFDTSRITIHENFGEFKENFRLLKETMKDVKETYNKQKRLIEKKGKIKYYNYYYEDYIDYLEDVEIDVKKYVYELEMIEYNIENELNFMKKCYSNQAHSFIKDIKSIIKSVKRNIKTFYNMYSLVNYRYFV